MLLLCTAKIAENIFLFLCYFYHLYIIIFFLGICYKNVKSSLMLKDTYGKMSSFEFSSINRIGGFILDDSSCDPYGVAKMREKMNGAKKSKTNNAAKKRGTGRWKTRQNLIQYGNH